MIVRIHDGDRTLLIEAPDGSRVYRPAPPLYDLVGGAALDELLKVPDGRGGFLRIPRSLVAEAVRRGRYGLRIVRAEEGGPDDDRRAPA